jgi:hypothetical protein
MDPPITASTLTLAVSSLFALIVILAYWSSLVVGCFVYFLATHFCPMVWL